MKKKKKKKKKDKCKEGDKCSFVTYEMTDSDSSSSDDDSDSDSSNYSSMFTHVAYYAGTAGATEEATFIPSSSLKMPEGDLLQKRTLVRNCIPPKTIAVRKSI